VQGGQDWKGFVKLKVHRHPVRLDKGRLVVAGMEQVQIEPNKLNPVVHNFFRVEQKLSFEANNEGGATVNGAPSETQVLQPGRTYTFPICLSFPNTLPSMRFHHDRGPTGLSAHGRDMAHGSIRYEATVRCSSFQQRHPFRVLPSPAAAPWLPDIVCATKDLENSHGRIFWGAATEQTPIYREEPENKIQLYISLVNESTAKIKHVRLELVQTVSLSTTDVAKEDEANCFVRSFPQVLWRLEHVPLGENLDVGGKLVEHVSQLTKRDARVAKQAVRDDLESRRPQPVLVTVPCTARPSHTGCLTRIQHHLRLTLLLRNHTTKNSQLLVPVWIV